MDVLILFLQEHLLLFKVNLCYQLRLIIQLYVSMVHLLYQLRLPEDQEVLFTNGKLVQMAPVAGQTLHPVEQDQHIMFLQV